MPDLPQPLTNPGLPPFCLLADPDAYRPCDFTLHDDPAKRRYWADFFSSHIDTILDLAPTGHGDRAACAAELRGRMADFDARPDGYGVVTMMTIDHWRDQILRRHGFFDCFAGQKRRENDLMLPLLAGVVDELRSLDGPAAWRRAVEGVFAGNIFDMGAKATAGQFKDASPDFHDTRAKLPDRPWRADGLDAFAAKAGQYRKAVFFVDNAGSDFVLGAVPMMDLMTRQGTRVVVAANTRPSLNDMTAAEVTDLWPRLVEAAGLDDSMFQVVATGTGEPLIDLRGVSDTLNAAAADADLVVLEGMGRGVESNWNAALTCDRLNLAMLKDEVIAAEVGGELYDCVCKFAPS